MIANHDPGEFLAIACLFGRIPVAVKNRKDEPQRGVGFGQRGIEGEGFQRGISCPWSEFHGRNHVIGNHHLVGVRKSCPSQREVGILGQGLFIVLNAPSKVLLAAQFPLFGRASIDRTPREPLPAVSDASRVSAPSSSAACSIKNVAHDGRRRLDH